MHLIKNSWDYFRSRSPFTLSLLLHILALMLFAYINWYIPVEHIDNTPAVITLHGKTDNRLKFQEDDLLDKFKVKDKMVYPLQEIDYRPVLPDISYYPEPKIREELNLIGIEAAEQEFLHPATGRQPLYTGEEKLAGSFTRHIKILREGGLDIVFVFDSTSSMASFLTQVKFKIANLIATFKKLVPTSRIGLVTYRDVGDDFVTKKHPLTHGNQSLQAFLSGIDPVGGGDWEEAVGEALRVAIEELNWKKKSKKIILLIGDAPPHKKDMPQTLQLIEKFRNNMSGTVSALDTSHEDTKIISEGSSFVVKTRVSLDDFMTLADAGGGECARLIDEEKVIRQMVVLVFGSRWEVCLDEFLKNL